MQVPGLALRQETRRMVLTRPKLGARSSSLTPAPTLQVVAKSLGKKDCSCPFCTVPAGRPTVQVPRSHTQSGTSLPGTHSNFSTWTLLPLRLPVPRLSSDTSQALRDMPAKAEQKVLSAAAPSTQPGLGRDLGGQSEPNSELADMPNFSV